MRVRDQKGVHPRFEQPCGAEKRWGPFSPVGEGGGRSASQRTAAEGIIIIIINHGGFSSSLTGPPPLARTLSVDY